MEELFPDDDGAFVAVHVELEPVVAAAFGNFGDGHGDLAHTL